jgi:hypothetical protein
MYSSLHSEYQDREGASSLQTAFRDPVGQHSGRSLALYSGGAEFVLRTGNRLSWGFLMVSSIAPGKYCGILIRPRPLPSKSFPIHNSPVILSLDVMQFIATRYGLDSLGLIPGRGRFASSPQRPNRLWGPPSASLSIGVKRTGHETDQSSPSSAEIMNCGVVPPHPYTSWMCWICTK